MDIDTQDQENSENIFSPQFASKLQALNRLQKSAPENAAPTPENQNAKDLEDQRSQTPLRIQYAAEVEVIRKKLGSLEDIRTALGLSRRQMARLLLVDPSAWTRWVKDGDRVPHHVYRALQWYMALIDKDSAWHPQNRFGIVQPFLDARDIKSRLDRLESGLWQTARPDDVKTDEVSSQLLDERRRGGYWVAFLLIIGLAMAVGFFLGHQF